MRTYLVSLIALLFVVSAVFATELSTSPKETVDSGLAAHGTASMDFFLTRQAEMLASDPKLDIYNIYGVSTFARLTEENLVCLKGQGYSHVIARGDVRTNDAERFTVANIQKAHAAGFKYVDIYMVPCYSCGNGFAQMDSLIKHLRRANATYDMVWVVVEDPLIWGNPAQNQAFFESIVEAAVEADVKVGINTSQLKWERTMGTLYTGGKNYPLSYMNNDNWPDFKDFKPFGGWTAPAMKQYRDGDTVCNTYGDHVVF